MEAPVLETPRLILRPPGPENAGPLADFALRNRDHLGPWEMERPPAYYTTAYWERHLEELREGIRGGGVLPFLLHRRDRPPEEIAGRCTFSGIVRGPFQAAYLGYSLDRDAQGHGYMGEALRSAIDYCFHSLNLHRIMANYMPTNERSGRLLRKLGFVPEGYARDYLYLAGRWQDHILTALTNDRWKPPGGAGP